jgi:SAM-dependent methyltransferase
VTGLDASPTLLRAAAEADPASRYVEGVAEALPFPAGAFDLAVAYNSLMDVADMSAAVREAARVLAPGGRLCACVPHPMADAGAWLDDTHFAVTEPYLERREMSVPVERNGLAFVFEGPAYPLQDYVAALEAAGLAIEALREPADPAGGRWARVPMFLMWRAVKR